MAQKRITVPQRVQSRAEKLQERLGVSNLGEVFAILVTRYGTHLQKTWECSTTTHAPIDEVKPANNLPTANPIESNHAETDPVITRLAALVDSF